jgi:acyl carrier protein
MALSRNEIKEKLGDILNMVMRDAEIDISALDEGANLVTDLGLNSVGVLYIVIAIEEFFGIEFENVGFGDFKTLGDVIDYIEKKL